MKLHEDWPKKSPEPIVRAKPPVLAETPRKVITKKASSKAQKKS